METITQVKEWGHSLGLIVPSNIVKQEKLKINDEVIIEIRKKTNVMNLFGSLKLKRSSQEMKDEIREGWKIESKDLNSK